ncbi:hypothetical protein BJX66DRAFT_70274 [Aspergillus keveii]|uniref:Uncharacterized protein n=1 Tax=Aspergillus keveii TaxID=714993 RepID=A0ABR4FP50_9EURO
MSRVVQTSPNRVPVFQASPYGMFITIIGIHSMLFQFIHNSVELLSGFQVRSRQRFSQELTTVKPRTLFAEISSLSGPSVSQLADEISSQRCSETLSHINDLLNTWRASWDAQYADETPQGRGLPWSSDPLRFWWLAKLYIILYACRSIITEESEFFPFLSRPGGDGMEPVRLRSRIVSWLLKFRKGVDVRLQLGSYLSQVMDGPLGS